MLRRDVVYNESKGRKKKGEKNSNTLHRKTLKNSNQVVKVVRFRSVLLFFCFLVVRCSFQCECDIMSEKRNKKRVGKKKKKVKLFFSLGAISTHETKQSQLSSNQ